MSLDLHPSRWVAILAAFILFFVVLNGTVRYTHGDSRYTLLASQALIEHGNLRLDPYSQRFSLWDENNGKLWMIYKHPATGHTYYDYPVGSPIFAVPFVAVARAVGFSPINKYDDNDIQMLIAATLIVFIFFLIFRLSLLYLGDWEALIFAGLFVLGSSITSTLGTALWSQDFQTIFVCLALLELAMVAQGKRERLRGGWLGAWLFAGYLCRPTMAPFIMLVFAYLAWRDRKSLPWVAGVAGSLLLAFVIWSKLEFGTWLPRYYSPGNWKPYGDYLHNLWPILFGPARGLFSFTPVLLLIFVSFAFKDLRRQPLFWLNWLWLILLTIVLLRSKNPWGGWCYGPRFYTELLPGLAWLMLMMFKASEAWALRWRKAIGFYFILTSLIGVYIHTWQGLYNNATNSWNGTPNIDQSWNIMRWDWRFPQFMATNRQLDVHTHEQELSGLVLEHMAGLPAGDALLFGRPDPDTKDFFDYWNSKDLLHTGVKVYNTILDVRESGKTTFWYQGALYNDLRNRPNVQVDPPSPDSILGPDSLMIKAPSLSIGQGRLLPEDASSN